MKNGSPTQNAVSIAPRIALFLAGVAAGAWCLARKKGARPDPKAIEELRKAAAELEARLLAQETAAAERFLQLESRLDEHAARLAEVPSTTQIVAAMELLLVKTMGALNDRLSSQGRSIEILKTTVSQTDRVLERILESLDSMHPQPEPPLTIEEELLQLTL
ncbi:MAG TPA: hypothetical protein VMH81_07355 [Bryobacteraceae bacterium]|nr:hypothetical protein [Bryobacteraceae bacterium]